jgi:hypothetical protein
LNLEYFAKKPGEEAFAYLESFENSFRTEMRSSGLQDRMLESHRYYYGQHYRGTGTGLNSSFIGSAGSHGQLKLVAVNHFRNLIRHMHIMATNQKPAWDVRAINTDLKNLRQTRMGSLILDSYMQEKNLGTRLSNAAEQAIVYSKGFIFARWNKFGGKPYMARPVQNPDGSTVMVPEYEGDAQAQSPTPFDVYYDLAYSDFSECPWVEVVCFENKFDLIAQHPDKADKIAGLPSKAAYEGTRNFSFLNRGYESDLVAVRYFYHLRTSALPQGRFLRGGASCVLEDDNLEYGEGRGKLPVFRMAPGELVGTTEGYTDAFDLLGLQKVFNTIFSAIFTNQQAHAVNKILIPTQAGISVEQLGEGLAAIKWNPVSSNGAKPEPLRLVSTPEECFKLLDLTERLVETVSGVNSVARGNPDASLKSGVALGLVQSMAIQFASGLQKSYAQLQSELGSFLLVDCLAKHANTKRIIAIAGKSNRSAMKSFDKTDIDGISGVVVEPGNPITKTLAGRVEIADKLLERGMLETPQQYLGIIQSGNLEVGMEDTQAKLDFVKAENEELMDGKPVRAMVGDPHRLHIKSHMSVTQNPELRMAAVNGDKLALQILEAAQAHLTEHIELLQTQNPIMSEVVGEAPAPPPMPPPGEGPPVPPAEGVAPPPPPPMPENAAPMPGAA